MKVQPADIVDRYSILLLKSKHGIDVNDELDAYEMELNNDFREYVSDLEEINGRIWELESDIRNGKEGKLGLEEVGRRALAIRDLNNKRIKIKNNISKKYGGFEEIKINHASEE